MPDRNPRGSKQIDQDTIYVKEDGLSRYLDGLIGVEDLSNCTEAFLGWVSNYKCQILIPLLHKVGA
jgi:hypothetical protein